MKVTPTTVSSLDMVKADYGRDFGWFVERDGVVIGELSDPQFVDMFWMSYAVEPVGDTDATRCLVYDPEPWQRCTLTFRNRKSGEVAKNAFSSGAPNAAASRVSMRALYLAPTLSWYERVQLWWWRRNRPKS